MFSFFSRFICRTNPEQQWVDEIFDSIKKIIKFIIPLKISVLTYVQGDPIACNYEEVTFVSTEEITCGELLFPYYLGRYSSGKVDYKEFFSRFSSLIDIVKKIDENYNSLLIALENDQLRYAKKRLKLKFDSQYGRVKPLTFEIKKLVLAYTEFLLKTQLGIILPEEILAKLVFPNITQENVKIPSLETLCIQKLAKEINFDELHNNRLNTKNHNYLRK